MRLPVILILLVAAPLVRGDVIVLKNGKRIIVDTAREKNGRVEYEIGDDKYAISQKLVDRIETGIGVPPTSHPETPTFTPSSSLPVTNDLTPKLIHDGKVDPEVLYAIDRTADQQTVAAAYFQAARFEQEHGNPDRAVRYYSMALGYLPKNHTILDHYAALLIQVGRGEDAISMAEKSTRLAPNSADGWTVLGYAYYSADRNRDAIESWKRSLEIRPDATVQKYLEKAQRDQHATADFQQRNSGHFTLRYQGHSIPDSLRDSVLQVLDVNYEDLSSQFGTSPQNITVILYTEQAFQDVTESPSWTTAINDGKIRVPISGLTTATPELARILRHELTHTFINQLSRGRCPQWLHEGIAQLMEPRTAAPYGATLARLFAQDHEVPLNLLEGSFMNLDGKEASVAYIQSLAVAEYLRDTYGMDGIRQILKRIGEGQSTESALQSTVHAGYAKLQQDVGEYLKDRYGT
ncbi:MAG: peptidase MA family metallohydrolase [Terriglobia bacterium]|nr:peptidase MA family metallohydrolase [Terriglobia bacterium]